MPTILSHLRPLTTVARVDSAVRLTLNPALDRRAVVNGAWWPYSRDAAAELPGLIAAVDRLLGRVASSCSWSGSWEPRAWSIVSPSPYDPLRATGRHGRVAPASREASLPEHVSILAGREQSCVHGI
ncbi:DUF5994 family protein [Nonomuraea sp. NPDC050536]|uniref:DUF5994 family protein n=1 Tax=Nonomuraea sp. NPDC050536 TaxID=3364366 RepID=UPI0037C9F658